MNMSLQNFKALYVHAFFVLDQYVVLDCYCVSSLKQQSNVDMYSHQAHYPNAEEYKSKQTQKLLLYRGLQF